MADFTERLLMRRLFGLTNIGSQMPKKSIGQLCRQKVVAYYNREDRHPRWQQPRRSSRRLWHPPSVKHNACFQGLASDGQLQMQ